jgi:hypothetical protein
VRPILLLSVLVLFSLALLCAAPVSAWAAPTIEGASVERGRDTGWEGSVGYHEWVTVYVSDPEGLADVARVTVTDPQQVAHDVSLRSRSEDGTWAEVWWQRYGEAAPPPPGTYVAQIRDEAGEVIDQVSVGTSEVIDDTPTIMSPQANDEVVTGTPTFSWTAPEGVGCFCVGVREVDGACAIWCPWVRPGEASQPATSPIDYNSDGSATQDLVAGHSYDWHVISHLPDPSPQSDPRAWANIAGIAGGRFTVYSPVPTIQSAVISRWRCLCPDPGNVESLCERAQVLVLDFDGWQDVSAITQTPDGLQLPDPLGWDCSTNDGPYLLSQTCGHNAPGLVPGRYTITASDTAGATVSLVSAQVSSVPPLHQITSPGNGAVLAETDLTPTFSWEGGPGAAYACVCVKDRAASDAVIWVKRDIPGDVTSIVYNDDGQGPPLVAGGRYLVVVRVHYPDEDASDGVGIDTLTGTAANFSIYSPVPTIQSADICRGRCLCADPGSTEFYHEGARISVLDFDGWQDASVMTETPDGLMLPDPDACDASTNDGLYTLYQANAHSPATLGTGSYTITAADMAGHAVSITSGPVSAVPPMHEITYPSNGAVLPETETTPTFSWTGATGAAYSCICFKDRGADDAVVWVRRDIPGDVTSIVYNDDGSATLPQLSPGGRYRLHVRVHYPDEDPDDGVAVDIFAAANADFSIYSPVPVVTWLEVRRGSAVSPEGTVSYQQRVKVLASDSDGAADVATVTVTDSRGDSHEAWWVCDQDQATAVFCWDSWGEADPTPSGTYAATVTDLEGNAATAAAQVSPLPDDPGLVPVIEAPAANYSIATAAPEFSWSVPSGVGCYCLTMKEVDGACQVWCPWLVSSPIGYGGADLLPGHLYDWSLWSLDVDAIAQSDPAILSGFLWAATGRFWVEPKFVGFLDPINEDGSSIFKLGATVPVKFQLIAADGSQVTDASCELHVAKVTDDIMGTYEEAVGTSAADSGSSFRYVDDHYQFNLGTKVLSQGTYRLRVAVNGATARGTTISLK